MQRTMPRHLAFIAALLAIALIVFAAPLSAQGNLNDTLLAEGAKNQVIQFNPTAALQQRIFADRFVPNSSEFSLSFEGVDYAAQRAENLATGAVRVYFVRVGDWGNVRFTAGGDALGSALMTEGNAKQVIQFNPGASLQQRIFADGYVPNSSEFTASVGGVTYAAQRAENLSTGAVRVYFVQVGDWANVRNTGQNAAPPVQAAVVPQAPPPAPPPPVQQPQPQAPAQGASTGGTFRISVTNQGAGLETVTVTNTGAEAVALGGWHIQSWSGQCEKQIDQVFTFPNFTLEPGASVNIYSAYRNSPPADGFKWRSDNIWDNGDDKAELVRPDGSIAAVHAYGKCR